MEDKTILKIFVGLCFVALVAVGGLLVNAIGQDDTQLDVTVEQSTTEMLTEDEAVSKALTLGYLGDLQEVELEDEDGTLVYAVEFLNGETETEVLVDAYSGAIVDMEEEDIITASEANPSITESEAQAIALAEVAGTVVEVELEKEDGDYVYAVEILTAAGEEMEVLVDVTTGDVVEIEADDEDDDDEDDDEEDEEELDAQDLENVDVSLSESEAADVALEAVGGGEVTEVEKEKENGKYIYEVEVQYDGDEYDVIIDMETGEVLDIEQD